jgi:threonine-phosphate decarboxylase
MERYQHGGNIWDKPEPLLWLDFSANINPWGPPAPLLQAVQTAIGDLHRYPDPKAQAATQAVADYLRVPTENLLLTNGGLAGLELLISQLRPSAAAVCQPAFVEYERLTRLYGIPVSHWLCWQARQSWQLPKRHLSELQPDTLVFLCNPSNPCASLLPPAAVEQLLQQIASRGGRLLLDEAFIDFVPGGSARQLALHDANLLIAGSLTKLFAIPGLRLGYVLATAELIAELRRRQGPWSLNLLAQAAAGSLPQPQQFVQDSLCRIQAEREKLAAGLHALGIGVAPSEVNFLLLDFREWGLTAAEINRLLQPYRLQLRDCGNFVGLDPYFARTAVLAQSANQQLLNGLRALRCGS